jgi:putative two-component system response regulator
MSPRAGPARHEHHFVAAHHALASRLKSRILIVDDDEANVALLQAFLAGEGAEIKAVTESRLAESTFHSFAPDLVLLDLHMPVPDGLEILRRLQAVRGERGFVPIVVVTADDSKVACRSALVLGADEFLTKPLDRTEVVLRVRNLLRTRKLFLELRNLNQ